MVPGSVTGRDAEGWAQLRICSPFNQRTWPLWSRQHLKLIFFLHLLEYLQRPEASQGHQRGSGRGAVASPVDGAAGLPEKVRQGSGGQQGCRGHAGQALIQFSSSLLPYSYKDAFEDFKEKSKKHRYYKPILIANINNCWNFR